MTPDRLAVAHVAVAELEAAAALTAAGFPTDLTRAPHPWELTTSFAAIDTERTQAEAEVTRLAQACRTAAIAVLFAYVAASANPTDVLRKLDDVAAGVTFVPGLDRIVADTASAVERALTVAAQVGLARYETDTQRAGLPAPVAPDLTQAAATAAAQGRRVAAQAVDAAIRAVRDAAWAQPRTEARDGGVTVPRPPAAFVRDAAEQAAQTGTRALEDVARQATLAGYGEGRNAGLTAQPEPAGVGTVAYYASELLDRNTCTPCSFVDGTRYVGRQDALADYPDGRYRDCQGGDRCRGTLVTVLERETPATRATVGR